MKVDYGALTDSGAASIFLYGTHDSYLMHRVNVMVERFVKAKGAQVQWADQQTLLSDPFLLHNQGDLFAKAANCKIVILEDATDKSASTVEDHIESPKPGVILIIPALVGTSVKKLKLLHEKAKNAAFATCYLSQSKDKQAFLSEMTQGLKLSREAQTFALQNMEDNIDAILSTLQKLPFYMEPGEEVSLEHFQACMSDFREANVKPLVTRLGDRVLSPVLRAYHEAKLLGAEEIAIIRSLNHHFSKLMQLRAHVSNGMPVVQAVQSLRPPVFFKEQDEFIRHHSRWSEKDIATLMSRLNTIELKIKTGYPFDPAQLWKPVFSMCKAA